MRRGLGIVLHEKSSCEHQGHLGKLTQSWLPSLKSHLLLPLGFKPTPEAQVQEAQVSGMQESLVLGPDSVVEPQGGLLPGEDSELLEMTPVEPFVPEDGPVQLPSLDQALPPSAATPSPVAASSDVYAEGTAGVYGGVDGGVDGGVAADAFAGVTARVAAVQYIVFSTVVHLGAPECYFPLPEVDI